MQFSERTGYGVLTILFTAAMVSCSGGGGGGVLPIDGRPGAITRVSVNSAGVQGNNASAYPSISSDGRYVAYESVATNLVDNDTNAASDIFVRDVKAGSTVRTSVAGNGNQANGDSTASAISGDGMVTAFQSSATDLVSGDTNTAWDIFVFDSVADSTARMNISSNGAQTAAYTSSVAPAISPDGRYVAFCSDSDNLVTGDTNTVGDIFVHDRQTGATTRVSVATDGSQGDHYAVCPPAISADGRYVAFASSATNLVTGDTNVSHDVFVHDLQTGATTRVSVSSTGIQGDGNSYGPAISADGRYVAFSSDATNLVDGDTNAKADVFVHDRLTGATTRASVAGSGAEGNGNSLTYGQVMSGDGRFVVFWSAAGNLVSDDTNGVWDVFVHDLSTGATARVSVSRAGVEGNGDSWNPVISGDGRYVAFYSGADNLVAGDTNTADDVYRAPNPLWKP